MQIPNDLPRFNEHALLIVTGSQYAKFYYAYEDEIVEITDIKVEDPTYSDREGFFMRSTGGSTLGSGSVYEPKNEYVKDSFIKKLNQLLEVITKEVIVDQIILFSPDYIAHDIRESISTHLREKISSEIHGNYTKQHPTEIISLIKKAV